MYDFLAANALYVVVLIALVVWAGIYIYLLRIESRIKKLEKS